MTKQSSADPGDAPVAADPGTGHASGSNHGSLGAADAMPAEGSAPAMGSARSPSESNDPSVPLGDLRDADRLARAFANGDAGAAQALQGLGRDAAFTVLKVAAELENPELAEFGRRLVPVRPESSMNLWTLRRRSVEDIVARELPKASLAHDARVEVAGGTIALFDPLRVSESLSRGGRPRRELARVQAGDIAWFGLADPAPAGVRLTTHPPPTDAVCVEASLTVQSGLIFVGPPEAADGPRLGALRLDPFSTALDQYAPKGRFLRLKAGRYLLSVVRGVESVVHIVPGVSESPRPAGLHLLETP